MSVIKLDNITKSYGSHQVLKGINQQIPRGEIIVIIGASGSGKSTLLRCINLIEPLTSGQILVDGQKIDHRTKLKDKSFSGMVFQSFNLFPHLTVLQNLELAPVKVKGRNRTTVKREGKRLLAEFGLADKADEYPNHLSGGQQQRIAIAREMIMNPDILLFDEPTSALDPENIKELREVIMELKQKGMTMIIVTHNIDFASHVADQIWFLEDGQITETGNPEEMVEKAKKHPKMHVFFEE